MFLKRKKSQRFGASSCSKFHHFDCSFVQGLLTQKGAESPDSGRIGVIGALVYFQPSEAVKFDSP